jgi:hypothetical protein
MTVAAVAVDYNSDPNEDQSGWGVYTIGHDNGETYVNENDWLMIALKTDITEALVIAQQLIIENHVPDFILSDAGRIIIGDYQ